VRSTERAAELGDTRWRELLANHESLVRSQLERFRGREVQMLGDGVLATFDGPARAIRCARTICDEVRSLGLEVRAGLHTGECEMRNGDIAGIAVHTGARVSAKASAGEVLVSSTVKDLVAGSGIEFSDRGVHRLKGVPGEWRLFSVASCINRPRRCVVTQRPPSWVSRSSSSTSTSRSTSSACVRQLTIAGRKATLPS
jgi:class 3 adenylate cyclase